MLFTPIFVTQIILSTQLFSYGIILPGKPIQRPALSNTVHTILCHLSITLYNITTFTLIVFHLCHIHIVIFFINKALTFFSLSYAYDSSHILKVLSMLYHILIHEFIISFSYFSLASIPLVYKIRSAFTSFLFAYFSFPLPFFICINILRSAFTSFLIHIILISSFSFSYFSCSHFSYSYSYFSFTYEKCFHFHIIFSFTYHYMFPFTYFSFNFSISQHKKCFHFFYSHSHFIA